jgi:hypothetical protein
LQFLERIILLNKKKRRKTMIKKLIWKFHEWNRKECPDCGCKDTYEVIEDYINVMTPEITYCCTNCKQIVNYWAYGIMEYPETKTGETKRKFNWLIRRFITYPITVIRFKLNYWKERLREYGYNLRKF